MTERVTRDQIADTMIHVDPSLTVDDARIPADAILALFEPSHQADEELGRCVDDLESTGRENAGLKRENLQLKAWVAELDAEKLGLEKGVLAMGASTDALRARVRELEGENAARLRQYNDQLSRVARADAATTGIRYEADALRAAAQALVDTLGDHRMWRYERDALIGAIALVPTPTKEPRNV